MDNDSTTDQTRGSGVRTALRRGARHLLRPAGEAELQAFAEGHADHRLPDGRRTAVRNGCQPAHGP